MLHMSQNVIMHSLVRNKRKKEQLRLIIISENGISLLFLYVLTKQWNLKCWYSYLLAQMYNPSLSLASVRFQKSYTDCALIFNHLSSSVIFSIVLQRVLYTLYHCVRKEKHLCLKCIITFSFFLVLEDHLKIWQVEKKCSSN